MLPHEPLIRSVLRQIIVSGIDIEDLLQETYSRILSRPSLEDILNPRQYAVQTARSVAIDHLRHLKVVSISVNEYMDRLNAPVADIDAQTRLEFREEIQAVADALAQVPERCREAFILRRIEGLSQKETALRLKISEKSVEKYMVRVVSLLMDVFGRGAKLRVRASHSVSYYQSNDDAFKPGH